MQTIFQFHQTGLNPNHDHGASLDAASHGLYQLEQQPPPPPHSLVDALSHKHSSQSSYKMTSSNLADLKTRLCLREGLNQEECERALLPTLEHASMVHSHVHHLNEDHDEAFAQTRNAIVYISLVVVVYVIVVLWLVSANFRSSLSSLAQSGKRNIFGQMVGPLPHLRDDGELESLIVVRDKGQKKNKAKCTTELDHEDDGDYV